MQNKTTRKSAIAVRAVLFALVLGILTLCARWSFRYYYRSAYPVEYSELVYSYSGQNNLPPSLVFAVIRTESGFDTDARSHVDALGLMQITEETYQWIAFREGLEPDGFDSLRDPETNIRYGTALLRLHLEEFGSVENALCAYHSGRRSLQGWLGDPGFSPDGANLDRIPSRATAHYVDKVQEAQEAYQRLYNIS